MLLTSLANQWLCSADGVYGFNYTPALIAARGLGLEIDEVFLIKVRAFEEAALAVIRGKDRGGCTPEKKAKCLAEFGSVHLDWICKTCGEMKT